VVPPQVQSFVCCTFCAHDVCPHHSPKTQESGGLLMLVPEEDTQNSHNIAYKISLNLNSDKMGIVA
jgi:hypothetical protein